MRFVAPSIAAAAATQAVLIAEDLWFGVMTGLAVGLLSGAAWARTPGQHGVRILIVTATLGGAGMAIGSSIDSWQAERAITAVFPNHPERCAAVTDVHLHLDLGSFLGSAMTLGMLALCVPGCLLLCGDARDSGRVERALQHVGCTLAMLAGMWIAGRYGHDVVAPIAGMHLTMLGGMVAGTALALGLGSGLRGLRS